MNARAIALWPQFARAKAQGILTDFPMEWVGVLGIAALNAVWASTSGFDLTIRARDLAAVWTLLAAAMCLRYVVRDRRAGLIIEYFTLCLVSAATFAELTYLCCAVDRPAVDSTLLLADRAFGFDWLRWFELARSHVFAMAVLRFLYNSIVIQGTYFFVFFGMRGDIVRLREVFWMTFAASAVACACSALWPALGTFEMFKLGDPAGYLADIKRLRHGDIHFNVEHLTGIVTFPSFHTSLAVIYTYAFRRTGLIGWSIAAVNILMLFAIPIMGGHYLVDMFGGAAVAVLVIATVRYCFRSHRVRVAGKSGAIIYSSNPAAREEALTEEKLRLFHGETEKQPHFCSALNSP